MLLLNILFNCRYFISEYFALRKIKYDAPTNTVWFVLLLIKDTVDLKRRLSSVSEPEQEANII